MSARGIFVTGTDTGAGKTLVSCAILAALSRRGLRVGAFKPVETGCRVVGGALVGEDCERLSRAAGSGQSAGSVAGYLFREPAAPLVAAEAEGVTIDATVLHERFDAIARAHDFVLVESAGGLMVPLTPATTTRDFARELGLPVVCVVASRLGCINHALLTFEALRAARIPAAGFVMNAVDRDDAYVLAARTNREMIGRFSGEQDLGAFAFLHASERDDVERLASAAEAALDLDTLVND